MFLAINLLGGASSYTPMRMFFGGIGYKIRKSEITENEAALWVWV
jgi:hypothetical protein